MKKKILTIILISCLLGSIASLPAFAAEEASPVVFIDGEEMAFSAPPTIVNGVTLVPMRAIFERMGAKVSWDQETRTVTASTRTSAIVYSIGSKTAEKNGVSFTLPEEGRVINGTTMVPLRFVGEALGALVGWEPRSNTITIATSYQDGVVTRIIDPVTIELTDESGKFSVPFVLAGLNMPNETEFAQRQLSQLKTLLLGHKVYADAEILREKESDPVVGYIFLEDGAFANGRLISDGFGLHKPHPLLMKWGDYFWFLQQGNAKGDALYDQAQQLALPGQLVPYGSAPNGLILFWKKRGSGGATSVFTKTEVINGAFVDTAITQEEILQYTYVNKDRTVYFIKKDKKSQNKALFKMNADTLQTIRLTGLEEDIGKFRVEGNFIYYKLSKDELEHTAYKMNKDGQSVEMVSDTVMQPHNQKYVYYFGSNLRGPEDFVLVRKPVGGSVSDSEEILSKYTVFMNGYTASPNSGQAAFVEETRNSISYLHLMDGEQEKVLKSFNRINILIIDHDWLYFTVTGLGVYRIHLDGSSIQRVGDIAAANSEFLGLSPDNLVFLSADKSHSFYLISRQ